MERPTGLDPAFDAYHAEADPDEYDHLTCHPMAHDFDPDGCEAGSQEIDEYGRRLCNDCRALTFYCTNDDQYHHAGANRPACFLVQEGSYDIPVPDAIPVPADWPGNEVNRLEA